MLRESQRAVLKDKNGRREQMKKILVIGSLNLDVVIQVNHVPVVGETILASDSYRNPGGKGANQAYATAKLGGDVTFVGAVGADETAKILLQNLHEVGSNVEHVVVNKEQPTGTAIIAVDDAGDNNIIVIPGANSTLSCNDIEQLRDVIRSSDIVVMQLEIPLETVMCAAKIAGEYGKMVVLDPAPVPEHIDETIYQYVDIIKPNETELGMLTKMEVNTEDEIRKAARKLRDSGVKNVIVTLGENGVYADTEKAGVFHVDSIKVDAVDSTAAGDSFTAAFVVKLAEEKDIKEAVEFANKVASIVVTRKGAQAAVPTLEEVKSLFEMQG